MKQQFYSQGGVEDPKVIETAKEGAEGVVFATFNANFPPDFVANFESQFNRQPRRWSIESYDGLYLLAKALESSTLTREGIRDALARTKNFKGVGGEFQLDDKGNGVRLVYLKTIKDGKFELIPQ